MNNIGYTASGWECGEEWATWGWGAGMRGKGTSLGFPLSVALMLDAPR